MFAYKIGQELVLFSCRHVFLFLQMSVLIIFPKLMGGGRLTSKGLLKLVIFIQYIPRLIRIFPLYKGVARTSGIITETAWAGAALNLFLYMLASHVSSNSLLMSVTLSL